MAQKDDKIFIKLNLWVCIVGLIFLTKMFFSILRDKEVRDIQHNWIKNKRWDLIEKYPSDSIRGSELDTWFGLKSIDTTKFK